MKERILLSLFSAGLPSGIRLSPLPDSCSVRGDGVPDADGWKGAMDQEIADLKLHVYELVPRMNGMRTLKHDWVFHRKFKNGVFEKNKGRLVAGGNHRRPGIDYGESISPVMRLEPLRTILALVAIRDLDITHFDVTYAYFRGTLKEEVYMEQQRAMSLLERRIVWRLKTDLYEELNAHMESEVLTVTAKDPAIYVKNSWSSHAFAAAGFWVDDCVAIGYGKESLTSRRVLMRSMVLLALEMSNGYSGARPLCPHDRDLPGGIIDSILARFNLIDATTVTTPLAPGSHLSVADRATSQDEIEEMANRSYRELVGSLARLALGTRPDIAFATSSLARCGHDLGRVHWEQPNESYVTSRGLKSASS